MLTFLLVLTLVASQGQSTTSTLIEAEAYAECSPSGKGLARPHDLPWASGRTGLIRFPPVERVSWRFRVATEGPHDVWFRYAAVREVPVRWSLDNGDWIETRAPATGAFAGRGAWDWALLGTVDLSSEEQTLSMAGAGLRPDCFWIERAGQGKPDWPLAPAAPSHTPEVLEKLRDLPPRSRAEWFREAALVELPSWIEETRVGLHTRLSVAWTDKPLFTRAEAAAASLGAPAIVRHVKSMSGACFWPSAWGAVAPWVEEATIDGVDPVAAMAQRARAEGLAFVAYYRHQEDRPLAEEHPDWVCRDASGQTIRTASEPRLCFHSPFANVTLGRFLEIAERGANGLYLDESHQPLEGCWCEWTRAAFLGATGLPLPKAPLLEDPLYQRFLAFNEDSLARRLWQWRRALRGHDSEFVLLVSTHRQPGLAQPLPTLRLASVGDAVKTEFGLGAGRGLLGGSSKGAAHSTDALLSLGWAMSRDGGFGRPAHVWIHALEGAPRWRAAAAAVVASGCVANLDHPESSLPDARAFSEAFELAQRLGAPLAGARPLPSVLLHLPERARNALLPDEVAAREKVIGPFASAWEALLNARLPARIASDDELATEIPADAQLLFLPAPTSLEDLQRRTVERFELRGGVVIESDPERLVLAVRDLSFPIALEAPPEVQAHWFRAPDGALLLGITNSASWVLDARASAPRRVEGARLTLTEAVRSITVWPAGESLPVPPTRVVSLPAFQEALILRVEE